MKKMLFVLAATVLGSASAFADDISLGNPGYGGTGCPAGSASATLSPDGKTLSLIFDKFVAEAGGNTGRRVDRKNCQIAIPVHVPQGYSFSVLDIDYRGFNTLPEGGRARFNVEYFLAYPGSPARGIRYAKNFTGPLNQDYLLKNVLGVDSVSWSPCGEDLNLRTSASIMTMSNYADEQAMSTVDSMDTKASIVYQLQWRQCN